MSTLRQRQELHAIDMMHALSIDESIIQAFKNGVVYQVVNGSKPTPLTPEVKKIVREVEDDKGCFVYGVLINQTGVGNLLSMLCVSQYEEDWEYEEGIGNDGYCLAWVENLTIPEFSEYGTVGLAPHFGFVERVR